MVLGFAAFLPRTGRCGESRAPTSSAGGYACGRGGLEEARRARTATDRRRGSRVWRMKMRNWGGFAAPPEMPDDLPRAVQLLGNATQRRVSPRVRIELERLVGAAPSNKEQAQQWKGFLQQRVQRRIMRDAEVAQALGDPEKEARRKLLCTNRGAANKYLDCLSLPESNAQLSWVFSRLEIARRNAGFLDERDASHMRALIGMVPQTHAEIVRVRNALSKLALRRKRAEYWPPKLPDTELRTHFTIKFLMQRIRDGGHSTEQGEAILIDRLGALPRNVNVARAWVKKLRFTLYMAQKRRDHQAKQEVDALKRKVRALCRLKRAGLATAEQLKELRRADEELAARGACA
ncbi:hypothetical protein FVE85_8573 [Porphyridium purpureum]|uniref:Uncharacterized protein n=1 Tax=Porphyridium purpureum TaxID=35688 RepID=A0A5J4YPA0_PORPP|nr:hypothetical protein FVE85_8573 [Porphyridium purpureum]|eukprot:POR5744..scf296_7